VHQYAPYPGGTRHAAGMLTGSAAEAEQREVTGI
jgi:hypothetical protein